MRQNERNVSLTLILKTPRIFQGFFIYSDTGFCFYSAYCTIIAGLSQPIFGIFSYSQILWELAKANRFALTQK